MSTFVIDASVAVRWVVDLPQAEAACDLLAHQNRLLAPDFLPAEVGNALVKLVRGEVLSPQEGAEAYNDFFRAPVRMLPVHSVAHRAFQVALDFGQGFYDCMYLALAEAEAGFFATADRRFWNAMKATPHGPNIHFIGR